MAGDTVLTPAPDELTSFEDADKKIDAFEKLLDRHGLKIEAGKQAELEHGCLVVKQMHDHHRLAKANQTTPAWPTLRDDLQVGIGTLNVVDSLLEREAHPDFKELLPHLRLLSAGSLAQTKRAPGTDQAASNKLFELRFALACMRTGTELKMDDPEASSDGENPDILCRMTDGRHWGFACKVVHGDSPMTLFERVEEGVDQIERSTADVGIVVVSFKNRLPHAAFFPELGKDVEQGWILGAHRDLDGLTNELKELVRARVTAMQKHVTADKVAELFRGKNALPGVLVPVEIVATFKTDLGPLPSIFVYLQTVPTELAPFNDGVLKIFDEINLGLVPRRVAP